MYKKLIIAATLFSVVTIQGCKTEFDEPKYSSGSANFTTYIALGNSLTAGYQDNALALDGQVNSYPYMLHTVFTKVGGSATFNLPYLTGVDATNGVSPAPQGMFLRRTTSKLQLKNGVVDCQGKASLGPAPFAAPVDDNINFYSSINTLGTNRYHNLGVPGAKLRDAMNPAYGSYTFLGNPFYARFASLPNTSTMLSDAMLSQPTFFTLWLGSNDVLGYATSGGSGSVPGFFPNDITPVDSFDAAYASILTTLTSNGAKGACANIPDVATVPYFNTVPYNPIVLTSQAQVDGLNAAWAGYNTNAVNQGEPQIIWKLGANAMIIEDPTKPLISNVRQIRSDELVCLSIPQDSLKCAMWGTVKAVPKNYILDRAELTNIRNYTKQYNDIIKKYADQKGLAYVDMAAYFTSIVNSGITFNGATFTTEYVAGGLFSLDGVHPNQRGYALVANKWIEAINAKYGSNFPNLDVNGFKGVFFP